MDIARWKKPASEREYFELYAALRNEAWSVPPEERDVETTYGDTHVFSWVHDGTPIVLLHGAVTSSLMWAPLIEELSEFSIYAVDIVGDPGLSTQTAPVSDGDDLATWFFDVLDGLGIEQAHVCGASYGGWIGCRASLRTPSRVASLTLLEPALDPVRPYFWVHGAMVGVSTLLPSAVRRPALRRLHMEAAADADPRVVKMARLGFMQFQRGLPRSTPLTDAQLHEIAPPTLLLLGAKSEIHHAKSLYERMTTAMPNVEAELVPNAGHGLPVDRPALAGERIRAFLTTPRD